MYILYLSTIVIFLSHCRQNTFDNKIPKPDHIIFVWFENKGYNKIIGSPAAPFINSLRVKGTLFASTHALEHRSYPNYIRFFSGQPNGVNSNSCIDSTPFKTENLYTILKSANKSFAWYSEGLPSRGSRICNDGYYVEKHNPVTIFSNVPDSINKPFSEFPGDFDKLENVVCISPNLINDMHDGTIEQGDLWLRTHFSSLIDWCLSNNSILVVFFDESHSTSKNRIPVVAIGEPVKKGFTNFTRYDHYSWCKTICAMFDANTNWTQELMKSRAITGCWKETHEDDAEHMTR